MHVRYLQHEHHGTVQLLLMPLSTASIKSSTQKCTSEDEDGECDAVPLPIQTFLWRQTNPFLGAKIGKLHEASCVTFERVVVQNILHGLSPSLSDAIGSVSRWKFIKAAFPHIIQCCGSLLDAHAAAGGGGLSPSLSKILYIMHWMVLDSASECIETSDGEDQSVTFRKQTFFSISSIQLFVYLIAPLADSVREEDISNNIRLESGLKIWNALWQYRQPDVLCFCAAVKQRKGELPMLNFVKKQTKEVDTGPQGIYLGDEVEPAPRRPSMVPPPKPPRSDAAVLKEKQQKEMERKEEEKREREQAERQTREQKTTSPRSGLLIDVGSPPTVVPARPDTSLTKSSSSSHGCSIVRSVSEYRSEGEALEQRGRISKSHTTNAFDVSPTSEGSLRVLEEVENGLHFVEDHSLSNIFHSDEAPLVRLNDICSGVSVDIQDLDSKPAAQTLCDKCGSRRDSGSGSCQCTLEKSGILKVSISKESPRMQKMSRDETISSCSQQTVVQNLPTSRTDASVSSIGRCLSSDGLVSGDEVDGEYTLPDPTIASFLDVAVVRALLIRHWSEDGVYWAMRYLLNRLSDIQTYESARSAGGMRGRSNSLPMARKNTMQMDPVYLNPTWADMQLEDDEDKGKLHVAFKDSRRRGSSDVQCSVVEPSTLSDLRPGHRSRRSSLNTLGKRERNRSDPSLNSSLEVLSIRETTESTSNIRDAEKQKEKEAEKMASKYYPEALGSTNFIEKNGTLSYTVIVQTLNSVMERAPAVRLCELALNISDVLLRIPADHSPLLFSTLTSMVFRIQLCLGCPHGCSEGVKSAQGDFLRAKAKTVLAQLEKVDQGRFKQFIADYVDENHPQQVLDLIHSLTAFCRSEFPVPTAAERRGSESRAPSYRNHFNEKDKGIEGRLIGATLKALVTRLLELGDQLLQPENMSLYQDVRLLVSFLHEHHGNPLRRVGLSALLDAIPKLDPNPTIVKAASTPLTPITIPHIAFDDSFDGDSDRKEKSEGGGSGKSSPSSLAPGGVRAGDHASLRRGLFKKREKEKCSANDESDVDSSPSTPRTLTSVDDAAPTSLTSATLKKKSAPKLHFAFNLLKTVRSDNMLDGECSDSETVDDIDADGESTKKMSDACLEIPKKKSSDAGPRLTAKRPPTRASIRLWGVVVPGSNLVDMKKISDGARRFSFLLETSRPGTFPDPALVAALLTLKSPVVARGVLLLECCHFVNRCNRGDWPEWIRSSHSRTFSLGGPLANRGTPSATRRMHTMQRTAGRYFYHWALHIGEQLSRLIDFENKRDKRQMKMEDVMEDFLDDGLVNDSKGEKCPLALQMIAVLLLQEITAFLRETFRTIPRGKGTKTAASSGWDKLLSHRRWSILSNTFQQQQTGSVSSIAEAPSGGIHLNERDRRISLSTAEEDSPRGSKDTIDQEGEKRDGSRRSRVSVRPPSLSVRLLSRQSTSHETESNHGSTRSTSHVPPPQSDSGRRLATGRHRLLKRGSPMGTQPNLESSHKRRQQASFRMRKQSRPPHDEIEKDPESQVLPAVSGSTKESLKAGSDDHGVGGGAGGGQSPSETLPTSHPHSQPGSQQGSGVYQSRDRPVAHDEEEEHMVNNLPWLKVILKMINHLDVECEHDGVCADNCFQRVSRQSTRLLEAVSFIYGDRKETTDRVDLRQLMLDKWNLEQQSMRRQSDDESDDVSVGGSSQGAGSRGSASDSRGGGPGWPVRAFSKSIRRKAHKANSNSLHSRQSSVLPRRESAMVGPQGERSSMAIKALLMEKMMMEKAEKEKDKDKEDSASKKISVQEPDRVSEESELSTNIEPNPQMLHYIRNLALGLVHSPLSTVLKSSLLLQSDHFKSLMLTSWKMLLDDSPHVVVSAASMFVVGSVKRPDDAISIIRTAFDSSDPSERTGAVQRFYALWRNRFQVWLKMEDGAQTTFKVPPPGIDFTLPSPPIGQPQLPVVDPPWMPHLKTKVEELSLKEEEHATSQTIMTMTRTRRKQKQEMVKRAVREAEERQCEQRQAFQLRGSPIVQHAAYEPALFHHQQEASEEGEGVHTHQNRHVMPVAQPLFPSVLLSAVPQLIEMLDDPQVDKNGFSVGAVCRKVIWTCIVEDPSLFFRHFLEKLTNRDKQSQLATEFRPTPQWEHLFSLLRKVILRFRPFPSQAAYSLLNYLFGFVMHYVRQSCEGGDKALGMALSLLWLLAPHVNGLYFKDLKQTLKKEQCDQALMITANVPSAKKIIVHGPDSGMGGIPSQFPVHEDTQFQQILTDSLEFFNIEDDTHTYFLTDAKTGTIHLPSSYVRDFYFFHRSFYPQLALVQLDPEEAMNKMRVSAFAHKFIDVGKVLLTHNILQYSPQHVIVQRIFFLHDELTHLPSFPRKSLESCFGMYHGQGGGQLKAIDALHKFVWAKLMSDMFEKMENAFMFADLHLFINVVNGIMIMHCEDVLILRRCAATYIAMSIHFNTLFASQGFFLIMPTLLRCYSQRQTNRVFCGVVEFLCAQFHTLHRKPFLLQMCGSVASILDNNNNDFEINPMKVKAKYWFNLLKAMEKLADGSDPLDILGLVPYAKPLKALDLCYRDDPNTFCVTTDALASCICVCAFAPESKRSYHMLLVMQSLLPHIMRRAEEETLDENNSLSAVKAEVQLYTTLCVEMKALINSCDMLARGPQRTFDLVNTVSERGKSFIADSPQFFDPPTTNEEETTAKSYHLREKKSTAVAWETADVEEQQKESYRRPRDVLLSLAATFIETAGCRLKELNKLAASLEHAKIPELLDHRCHVKLSEIALALLKIAPYDLNTMSCQGLQRYFAQVLPVTDWSIESNRSALNIVLRRLDKTISKLAKRSAIKRRVNWAALSAWLTGLCDTLSAFPYIAHLHPLKTTTQMCLRIMVGESGDETTSSINGPTILHQQAPPSNFAQATLRLTTILMQTLGQLAFSLEFVCSNEGMGVSADRLEPILCHVLIPLFLRASTPGKEASVFQTKDLLFCLNIMQNAVSPPLGKQSQVTAVSSTSTLATTFIRAQSHDVTGRQGSVSVTDRGHSATVSTNRIVRESVCQSIYLALKVMLLCFGKLLGPLWPRVAKLVKDLLNKKAGGQSAIDFVDFILQSNLPVSLLIVPIIHNRLKQKPSCEAESVWAQEIQERLSSSERCTSSVPVLLSRCAVELTQLKEEFGNKPLEMARSYTPTMTDPHSDSSTASLAPHKGRPTPDRRASTGVAKQRSAPKENESTLGPSTILEDVEDESGEKQTSGGSDTAGTSGRVTKSPSVPLNKIGTSPRPRSMSGFGMWRSVRRKSRTVSHDSETGGSDKSLEMSDMKWRPPVLTQMPPLPDMPTTSIGSAGPATSNDEPSRTSMRRSTEVLVHAEQPPDRRHRFVSFSTPKSARKEEELFEIVEQHHLV